MVHTTATRRFIGWLMVAAVGVLTVIGFDGGKAAAAASADEVTWGVRTADNANGSARNTFAYSIEPGDRLEDAIVVSNHGAEPLDLDVYASDGFTTTSGQLDVVTRDTPSIAVGVWAQARDGAVTIPAGESVEVPFTIDIPENTTPGDYAGAVVTSLSSPAIDDGIRVDRRLGVRIHLRVGGELAPALAIEDLRVAHTGSPNPFGTGSASATLTVQNIGNARLSARQRVDIVGIFGWWEAAAQTEVPELLPGESWETTVTVPGIVPAFLLTATATLSPSLPDGQPVPEVTAEATVWAIPWALSALIILAVLSVVLIVLFVRMRNARRRRAQDARVERAVEKALRERERLDAETLADPNGS